LFVSISQVIGCEDRLCSDVDYPPRLGLYLVGRSTVLQPL